MKWFCFNGKKTTDFDILLTEFAPVDTMPGADVETISIPGRNGDLRIYNNRFENVELVYKCGIRRNYNNMRAIKNWLCQLQYCRLYDNYQPEYYRLAALSSGISPESNKCFTEFDVKFSCKPFLYRFDGDVPISIEKSSSTGTTITNPEGYYSRPIIKITKSSTISTTITIADKNIILTGTGSYIIDAETQNCYNGSTNRNADISTADIVLPVGTFVCKKTSGGELTEFEIIPRWRTL